jgi:tetratricopeptide (TPR) repeat protein
MDLTTIFTLGSLLLGLIVGNAAYLGESLYIKIAIPSNMEKAGFSQATAEGLFVAEINRYTQVPTIIPTPSIVVSTAPSLAIALAKPLQLSDVVYAVQSSVREYGVVRVTASLVANTEGSGLKMFLVVSNPPDPPVALSLAQPDGNPKALIEAAARETMLSIGPYKVALTDFQDAVSGDATGFDRGKQAIAAGLGQAWDPRPEGATETALLMNLRGMIAVHDGNMEEATKQFALSKTIPGAFKPAYALIAANQAFLELAKKQPAQAVHYYDEALKDAPLEKPGVVARFKTLAGLIDWEAGNTAAAEQDFRAAIATNDDDETVHLYLAEMLTLRGDTAGAERERISGTAARRFAPQSPAHAQSIFLLDPIHGGYRPLF